MKTSSMEVGLAEGMVAARIGEETISNVIVLARPLSPVLRVRRECRSEDFLERMAFLALLASAAALIVIAVGQALP